MTSIQKYTVEALKALKGLVGEIAFEAAIAEVHGPTEKHVHFDRPLATMNTVESVPVVAEEQKKRTRKITESQRQVVSRNMAALQAYTKAMKGEMGEGTTYADMKKTAGERWKALSKEEKEAWIATNMTTEAAPNVKCTVCKEEIINTDAHKACLIKVIDVGKKNGKTVDESIKEYVDASGAPVAAQTPIVAEKRGRGRPKRDTVASYTPTWNVRRLSKTETDTALEDSMALPGTV